MNIKDAINHFLKENEQYIAHSAREASEYFKHRGIKHLILDGVMDLSPDDCKAIYEDMCKEILTQQVNIVSRYGLWVAIQTAPIGDDDVGVRLYCGIYFPDMSSSDPPQT